jgi:hypothetical protein
MEHQFRIELFVTVLFITVAVLSIIEVGFTGVKETIFTTVAILEVPVAYFGSKQLRKFYYDLKRGYGEYED